MLIYEGLNKVETCIRKANHVFMCNELGDVISIHLFNLCTNLKAGADVKLRLLSICECFSLILRGIGTLSDSVFDVSNSDHLYFSEVELVQSNLNKPNEI